MVVMREMLHALLKAADIQSPDSFSFPGDWSESDWDVFQDHARHHRVTAILGFRHQHGLLANVPEPVATRFLKDLHETRLRHLAAMQILQQLETAFEHAGIPVISLKGPRLAEEAYPSTGLRSCDDIDLLVDPESVEKAETVLRGLGYRSLSQKHRMPILRGYHFHSQWVHPETAQCVELHWRPADSHILPPPTETFSYVADLQNNPAAMPVYLAVHMAKHGFANDAILYQKADPLLALHPAYGIRLIWILDFKGLMAARTLQVSNLLSTAKRWNAVPAIELALYLASGIQSGEWRPPRPHRIRAHLLDKLAGDLARPAQSLTNPAWWAKYSPHFGFRPIRLLDLIVGGRHER